MIFSNPKPDKRVRHVQVETLYKNLKSVLFANYINVPLFILVMWNAPISHGLLLSWVTVIYIVTTIRVVFARRYWQDENRAERIDYWQRVFTITSYVSGSLWGIGGYMFFVPDSGIYETFVVVFVLGVGAGSLAFMASHRPTFLGFFTLLLAPLFVRMLVVGDLPHTTIAALIAMYWFVFLAFSRNINQTILESMLLRLDNLDLVVKLTEEKEAAEKANIAKSRFLAAASHDLRQPLHALSLLAGGLAERIQYKEVKDIVLKIRSAVGALENLFNALLDISKLDSGVLQPCIEEFHLKAILERIENDQRPEAEKKGLDFVIEDCGNVVLESDSILLERILRNFISNAIRYTQNGKVRVTCHKQDTDLVVEITDTGMGIPKDMQEEIFTEYVQVDNPERNRTKGLGLGLAIVARIAKLLNHHISVESEVGKGSTFSVAVPYKVGVDLPTPQAVVMPEFSNDLHELSVLVIDDEISILEALNVLLGGWGCEIMLAESVEQARKAINSSSHPPDAIISDYRLRDGINGVECIKAIEAMVGHEVPAILITGDMEIDTTSGVSDLYRVLHKPVQPARLRAFLKHVQSLKLKPEQASGVTEVPEVLP